MSAGSFNRCRPLLFQGNEYCKGPITAFLGVSSRFLFQAWRWMLSLHWSLSWYQAMNLPTPQSTGVEGRYGWMLILGMPNDKVAKWSCHHLTLALDRNWSPVCLSPMSGWWVIVNESWMWKQENLGPELFVQLWLTVGGVYQKILIEFKCGFFWWCVCGWQQVLLCVIYIRNRGI